MKDNSIRREAKRRIEFRKHEKSRRLFYLHVLIFLGAVSFWFFTMFSGTMTIRTLIVAMIWILLIVRHGMSVYRLNGILREERQREILENEMDQIREEDEAFEKLELKEKQEIRKEWDDKDLV